MCGIVGLITSSAHGFSDDERQSFLDGLFMDALRGTDGTGVMYGRNNGEVVVMKEASPSWEFIGKPEAKTMSTELFSNGAWAFGHNRAATRGAKKDENSHPFIVENEIVLLQNGTYNGSHHHHKKTEVDTEAIAHVIYEHQDDLGEALGKIDAAYVLVWWNNRLKTLNIIRNEHRPLWTATSKEGSEYFFSEWGMMYAATVRQGIEFKKAPVEVPVGVHLKFDFSEGMKKMPIVTKTKTDITYKKTVGFFPPVVGSSVRVWTAPASTLKNNGGTTTGTKTSIVDLTAYRNVNDTVGPLTSNGLRISSIDEAYSVVNMFDPTHNTVGNAIKEVFGNRCLFELSDREKLANVLTKPENNQLLVDWVGYETVSHHALNDFYYIFGEVDAPDDDLVRGLPVFMVVRGDLKDVKEYIRSYQALVKVDHNPRIRVAGVGKDAAKAQAPGYCAWPINANNGNGFVDWNMNSKATNVH